MPWCFMNEVIDINVSDFNTHVYVCMYVQVCMFVLVHDLHFTTHFQTSNFILPTWKTHKIFGAKNNINMRSVICLDAKFVLFGLNFRRIVGMLINS